jgi:hypothetical protein
MYSAKKFGQHAGRPSASAPHAPPDALLRLRPHAALGPTPPQADTARGASTAPLWRRTRAVRAGDRRSVRGAGRTCAGQGAVVRRNRRRHRVVTPGLRSIKGRRVSPPSTPSLPLQSAAPCRRGRHRQAAASLRLQATARVSKLPRTHRASLGSASSTPFALLAGARAAAATAAGRRRIPTPAAPPHQLWSSSGPR